MCVCCVSNDRGKLVRHSSTDHSDSSCYVSYMFTESQGVASSSRIVIRKYLKEEGEPFLSN